MSLQNLSNLFLYELCAFFYCKKQVIAALSGMSRLASHHELLKHLEAHTDKAREHMYVIRTIISSYQAIPPVKNCPAIKGLIESSELLLQNCGAANADALNAALICTSLDFPHYELAKLDRLRLYAQLLGDRQTLTLFNAVLDDELETKHRLAELMGFCLHLGFDSPSESLPVSGDNVHPASPLNPCSNYQPP
jgi:ferritin-like metal-binding protein YciE